MRILVDVCEPKEIREYLTKFGCDIEVRDLRPPHGKGGDYILDNGNVGIERKHIRDLVLSLIQKKEGTQSVHLYEQLTLLKQNYTTSILLIEGNYPDWVDDWHAKTGSDTYRLHHNAFLGIFVWCIRNGIYTIHTRDERDSARFIYLYAKKLEEIS